MRTKAETAEIIGYHWASEVKDPEGRMHFRTIRCEGPDCGWEGANYLDHAQHLAELIYNESTGGLMEIKSDYEHQRFYGKVLDELEDRWQAAQTEWLNNDYRGPEGLERQRKFWHARNNYRLVKLRYDSVRYTKEWPHYG